MFIEDPPPPYLLIDDDRDEEAFEALLPHFESIRRSPFTAAGIQLRCWRLWSIGALAHTAEGAGVETTLETLDQTGHSLLNEISM
jgi:hypothetical protein